MRDRYGTREAVVTESTGMRRFPRKLRQLVFDVACGALMLTLASLKLTQSPGQSATLLPTWVLLSAAVIELALGAALLAGRARKVVAGATIAMSCAFLAWTIVVGPDRLDGHVPCGCFGAFHATLGQHLIVTGILLSLGGAQLRMAISGDGIPAAPDPLDRRAGVGPSVREPIEEELR